MVDESICAQYTVFSERSVLMCIFCQEFNDGSKRIIWEDDDWIVIPGLGAFVEGYCLLFPRDCYRSFSHLPTKQLRGADKVTELVRQAINSHFGPVAIAEHGVSRTAGEANSSCCSDHAHLHFFPIPEPSRMVHQYELVGGEPIVLDSLSQLADFKGSYLFLSPTPESRLCWIWQEGFEKQFARRVAASLVGETQWDWRTDHFKQNMQRTLEALRPLPNPWRNSIP
jgi:ATP adenylyltransferase